MGFTGQPRWRYGRRRAASAGSQLIAADPRPDWYLLWYFSLLALCPAHLETYVILLAPLFVGPLLISAPLVSNKGERSGRRRPWAIALLVMTAVMIGSLWILGLQSPWSPKFGVPALPAQVVGVTSGPVADGRVYFMTGAV